MNSKQKKWKPKLIYVLRSKQQQIAVASTALYAAAAAMQLF